MSFSVLNSMFMTLSQSSSLSQCYAEDFALQGFLRPDGWHPKSLDLQENPAPATSNIIHQNPVRHQCASTLGPFGLKQCQENYWDWILSLCAHPVEPPSAQGHWIPCSPPPGVSVCQLPGKQMICRLVETWSTPRTKIHFWEESLPR